MLEHAGLRERLAMLARTRRSDAILVREHAARTDRDRMGERGDGSTAEDHAGPTRAVEAVACSAGRSFARAPEREAGIGVEEFLPGGEWRDDHGAVFVHERLRSAIERPRAHWGNLEVPPEEEPLLRSLAESGIERALFLDLETGGLSSSPVFLAGTMHWNGSDFVLRQYFARHYGEEGALLRALAQGCHGFEFLVTFNGKSYDAPFLSSRAIIHRVLLDLPPRHLDLLHPARRRWRERLPDCRLQTLERHVCRRFRSGDVPSDEVPALYHDFVRRGDPYRLVPVFHHNLLDVITMGEILRALCATEDHDLPSGETRRREGESFRPPAVGELELEYLDR
jgi:uncharacterized protein YprB with RNaseH-like and TPR domain